MAQEKRKHKATYARDKKTGGYLVRVIGPNAVDFAGREVPVEIMGGGEHQEKLTHLVWSGIDKGIPEKGVPGTGQPAALYKFESKPREKKEAVF